MIKKYKNKIIIALIALVLMSVYIFITTWQAKTYEEVHVMYPLSKSKNPKASEEFLKALEYRIYIKELHPFFDYDSFVMAPLLMKLNYHFKRGKALLPKESVEDIVWWTLFYKEIYGLLVPPRNDNTMAYENMPPKEFAKMHDAVYRMIMRYPEGKVYFDIPGIKAFRFKAIDILVGFYVGRYSRRYQGMTNKEQMHKANYDPKTYSRLEDVKNKYALAYKKYINNSKDKNILMIEYFAEKIYLIAWMIENYTFVHNTQKLPTQICYSKDMAFIFNNMNKLLSFVTKTTNHQSQLINRKLFDSRYTDTPIVLKVIDYRCPNLHPKSTQIVEAVNQLNKKLNTTPK